MVGESMLEVGEWLATAAKWLREINSARITVGCGYARGELRPIGNYIFKLDN